MMTHCERPNPHCKSEQSEKFSDHISPNSLRLILIRGYKANVTLTICEGER